MGEWARGKKDGMGTYFSPNGDVYTGEFLEDKKWGMGKHVYANGDQYRGEYKNDMRHGKGTLLVADGNIYEGMWIADQKEGPGKFLYASTLKVYEGEWAEGNPRCGEFRSPTEEEREKMSNSDVQVLPFALPQCELEDPFGLLEAAKAETQADRAHVRD
jgi:hypothetical protein